MINIREIKDTVHRLMPGSSLDKILASEPDQIPESEFAVKANIWSILSKEAR